MKNGLQISSNQKKKIQKFKNKTENYLMAKFSQKFKNQGDKKVKENMKSENSNSKKIKTEKAMKKKDEIFENICREE